MKEKNDCHKDFQTHIIYIHYHIIPIILLHILPGKGTTAESS